MGAKQQRKSMRRKAATEINEAQSSNGNRSSMEWERILGAPVSNYAQHLRLHANGTGN